MDVGRAASDAGALFGSTGDMPASTLSAAASDAICMDMAGAGAGAEAGA